MKVKVYFNELIDTKKAGVLVGQLFFAKLKQIVDTYYLVSTGIDSCEIELNDELKREEYKGNVFFIAMNGKYAVMEKESGYELNVQK